VGGKGDKWEGSIRIVNQRRLMGPVPKYKIEVGWDDEDIFVGKGKGRG
jgi:hypothetical protein